MDDRELEEFKLKEKGDNWWYFKKERDMGYFTVTLIHDGTVVLSGDYGVLAFRRKYFPTSVDELIGFPNSNTNIDYFAEKVCNCMDSSAIMEWTREAAIREGRDYLREYYPSYDPEEILEEIKSIEPERGDAGLFEMLRLLRLLQDFDNQGDWDGRPIGMDYTHTLKVQFGLFKYAMGKIKEEKDNG